MAAIGKISSGWSSSDDEEGSVQRTPPKKPCVVSVVAARATPQASSPPRPMEAGFSNVHSEYRKAIGQTVSRKPPPLYKGRQPVSRLSAPKAIAPLIVGEQAAKTLIQTKLTEKQGGAFAPFVLHLSPTQGVTITDIQAQPIGSGQHSDAYQCTVEGLGDCVLKLYRAEGLSAGRSEIIEFTAYQLLTYAYNMNHSILKEHTARFFNYDPHVNSVLPFLDLPEIEAIAETKEYVREHLYGVTVSAFVPGEMPVVCDQGPLWQQLKDLFGTMQDIPKTSSHLPMRQLINNDLRKSNFGVAEGKVILLDLLERPGDCACPHEITRTFGPAAAEWLLSKPPISPDKT